MRLIGYARTSTIEQVAGLDAQIRDLAAAKCDVIYNEQVSSVGERPEYEAALADLQPGDTLVVTKLDRLARSLSGLLALVENLTKSGRSLRILNMGLDTATSTGRLMLAVMGAIAQFEREMMLERQKEGIAKAQAEGKYRGRDAIDPVKCAAVIEYHACNLPIAHIAKKVGLPRRSIYRILETDQASRDLILVRERGRGLSRRKVVANEIRS